MWRSEDQENKMKYAIVESGGKQYKAVEGETIDVDRLVVEPGTDLKLEQVLLMVDGETVTVGTPTITGISVLAKVLAHVKGEKLTVFKYRPKKRIRVKTGHRQNYTRLLIEQIGDSKAEKEEKVEKVAKAAKVGKAVKAAKVEKTEKTEKLAKAKKPAVEKITKPVKKAPAKKAPVKKAPVKKAASATKTVKKPAVKKTTKTEKK
jgi:large subunit ribosomal protein L21